jgi:hypothetical protein
MSNYSHFHADELGCYYADQLKVLAHNGLYLKGKTEIQL